jgi:hypothetical protein
VPITLIGELLLVIIGERSFLGRIFDATIEYLSESMDSFRCDNTITDDDAIGGAIDDELSSPIIVSIVECDEVSVIRSDGGGNKDTKNRIYVQL